MAGTATHLAIADKIYEMKNCKIKNPALFYSGNIAPDAIHAKTNYQRSDKKRTHLTENISGNDFQNPEKIAMFHTRVNNFIDAYYDPNDKYADLYLGYIVHLITDELFNIHIREKFVIRMEEDGVYNEDPEFFKRIISDIENIDHIVINRYPYKKNIKQLLNDVWDYEIKDYISSDEINRSKKWIIDTYLSGKATDSKALYYDYESAYNFVLFASGNIVNRLTNNIDYKIIL